MPHCTKHSRQPSAPSVDAFLIVRAVLGRIYQVDPTAGIREVGLRVYEVFTPAGVPTVTYVEREQQNLEQQLRSAIRTPGQIASLSGPSKSGKTVLINKVIARDDLIAVSGAAIKSAEMLWERVLTWMGAPSERAVGSGHTLGLEVGGAVSTKAGIILASGETEASFGGNYEHVRSQSLTYGRGGIDQVVREIANSDFVVFVDDFHYMSKGNANRCSSPN